MFILDHYSILSEWIFRMIEIINKIINDCRRFQQASLLIPQVFLPNPLTPKYASSLDLLMKGGQYKVHTYNSTAFSDCVSAHQVCVQIFNVLDAGTVNASRYAKNNNATECSYGIHIHSSNNYELAPSTISLPFDIVTSNDSPNYGVPHLLLPIVTVVHPEVRYRNGVILHPDFPASEPVAGDIQTSFGKIFGVPFQVQHGK